MDCEQAISLISAQIDREIQPDDRVLLDLHLRECPACRATAEAFALQHQELRGAFEPRRRAAVAVAQAVKKQLPTGRASEARSGRRRGSAIRVAAVCGVVAAAILFSVLIGSWLWPHARPVVAGGLKPLPPGLVFPGREELTPRARPIAPAAAKLAVGDSVETRAGEKRRLALPDGSVLYVNQNTKVRLDAERQATLTAGTVYVEVAPRAPGGDAATFAVNTPEGPVKAFGTKFEVHAESTLGSTVAVTQGRVTFDDVEVRAGQELAMKSAEEIAKTNRFEVYVPVASPRASHRLDWTRDLMAAAESPLVPASQYDGGALVAVDPYGQEAKLSLRNYHIDVHIEDGFARTTIDQTYFNNNPWQLEGTFYFPLPPDASLSRLAMYVNGELMEGGMTDREWGNAVYEKVVRSKRDPALLEWVDGSTFKMRVFPLEGRQEKRIVLSYTQRLSTLYGRTQYRFPAGHSLQVVDRWSFHGVVANGGGQSWNSPTHPAMHGKRDGDDLVLDARDSACKVDRDVEVDLADPRENNSAAQRIRFSSAEQDGSDYLMLRFRPDLPGRPERQRRDWVFLFESSADRDPLLARAQIDIIRHLLEHVEHDDSFTVLTAGTNTHTFSDAPVLATPENIAGAITFLEHTHLVGALDLGRALTDAAPLLNAGSNPYLVHVGSGLTAMGRKQDKLAELLPVNVRYIGVGVGKHWGRSWMKETAESTGGYFTQINPDEPIAWRAFDLLSTLNTPRLLHVQVKAGDDSEEPRFLTDNALIAQGEEICAAARIGHAMPHSVVVTGVLDGQPYRRELVVMDAAPHADYLPRTWAKLEIDRLLADDAAKNKERIVELSKAMYVMTPFTSLLVLENEEMYRQYKVDRGRKDHWAMYPCPQKIPVVFEPDPTQAIDVRNAPKTPKPVANLVAPTIVTRSAPRFLNGGMHGLQGDNELVDKLKRALSTQERLVAQTERTSLGTINRHGFLRNGREADNKGLNYFNEFHSSLEIRDGEMDEYRIRLAEPASVTFSRWKESESQGVEMATAALSLPPLGRAANDVQLWGSISDGTAYHRKMHSEYGMLGGRDDVRRVTELLNQSENLEMIRDDWASNSSIPLASSRSADGLFAGSEFISHRDSDAIKTGLLTDHFRRSIEQGRTPALLYQAPTYTGDARLFSDLISYAPGLNTSDADIQAVLDAEAAPNLADAPGHIDADARRLIDRSRPSRWRTLTLGGDKDKAGLVFHFDGAGRYIYDHISSLGLRERVVCDGATLWHLYPDLGLAAQRTVSRFHRAEVAGLTPWVLPPAEDLARGADVEFVDEHTVTVTALGARTRRTDDDKPAPYYRLELVFADGGPLAERRLVEALSGKVALRERYDDEGGVRILDGDGKELASSRTKITETKAPDLSVDLTNQVVLHLPLRSRAHIFEDLGLDASRPLADDANGCFSYLEGDEAVELLAGAMTEGNADEATRVFRDCFASHDDLRKGLFTVLATAGVRVCTVPGFQQFAESHKSDPLARYLALLNNRAYDWLHQGTGLDLGSKVGDAEGFFGRLAAFHDLEVRWQAGPSPWIDAALRRADEKQTFDFIRRNHDNVLGWALQIHVQNHARNTDARLYRVLAESWGVLAGDDGAYLPHYEQARCLLRAGKKEEARKLFLDLHAKARKTGVLPRIDGEFREALRAKDVDEWTALAWKTAADLIDKKDRPGVVTLAWQCRQVGDAPLSDNLLSFALNSLPSDSEGMETMLAAVEYLSQTDQTPAADDLLNRLLSDEANAKNANLWRLAAILAERREMPDRATSCLEKALDLEYADLPPVIDLQSWRTDYGKLLAHYQTQATTLAGLKIAPPSDLAARTVRAVDRWRAHDPETDAACRLAGGILKSLGERDKAWEYLTTPGAAHPTSISWPDTAQQLSRTGDLDLADRSYSVACEQEPDDALLAWRKAQNLRQAGRLSEADALLFQIAAREWPEHYQWVRAQAVRQIGGK